MPTASQTAPRHVLRSILRHIRSAPKQSLPNETTTTAAIAATITTRNPLEEHVIQQYRSSMMSNTTSTNNNNNNINSRLHQMAYHLNLLKQDLKERGRLHELDGGAEKKLTPKELSRRAAARAGLKLPDEHDNRL